MSVVKVYDMSSVDKVKQTYQQVQKLQENRKYEEYTKENIMLVRTTSVFPDGRIIKPLSEVSYITKNKSNFIYQSLFYEMDYDELKNYESYELVYRNTIHFTENGLVSSHMYGNFDNQDFIILDPLNEHVGKSDIRHFGGQDTFIKGNVVLSDKTIIIVKSESYDIIKESYPEIENYNIILYNGIPQDIKDKYIEENQNNFPDFDVNDQRAIVEMCLMDLGYVPEIIGSHYIIDSPTSSKINKVNEDLAKECGVVANTKHNYTEEYEEDFKKNMLITEMFDKLLLDFIIKNHNIDNNIINVNNMINKDTAYKLIELLGNDAIVDDIKSFNYTIKKMQELNMLPTSEEFINNNIPDIYSAFVQLKDLEITQKLK